MESLIYTIAESLKVPNFLFDIPTFYEIFSNWYFYNFHYWEFIPDDPKEPIIYSDYKPNPESEIEWYLSDDHTIPNIGYKDYNNFEDLFDYSDHISDTGSDYSLHWYRSD